MTLAQRAMEGAPSALGRLIVECTYRRAGFVPKRDHRHHVRARFACSIAAHLLKTDAQQSVEQVAKELDCSETKAGEYIAQGNKIANQSEDALSLMAKVRDDVHEMLEEVGMNVMLDTGLAENAPVVTVAMPTTISAAVSFVSRTLAVSESLITGVTRKTREIDARHITMALIKAQRPERSRSAIGSHFSKRDGSTVLSSLRRVDAVIRGLTDDPDLLRKIGLVCDKLGVEMSFLHLEDKT